MNHALVVKTIISNSASYYKEEHITSLGLVSIGSDWLGPLSILPYLASYTLDERAGRLMRSAWAIIQVDRLYRYTGYVIISLFRLIWFLNYGISIHAQDLKAPSFVNWNNECLKTSVWDDLTSILALGPYQLQTSSCTAVTSSINNLYDAFVTAFE